MHFTLTPQSPVFSRFKDAKGSAALYEKRKARTIRSPCIFLHYVLERRRAHGGEWPPQSPSLGLLASQKWGQTWAGEHIRLDRRGCGEAGP